MIDMGIIIKYLESKYKLKITSWGISAIRGETYLNYYYLNNPCESCHGKLIETKDKAFFRIEEFK